MSDRSWFYASQGQQQGPFPEAQFRSLIARGAVTPDTLVWTEGMSGWQRAGDIPGLVPAAGSRPPAVPQPAGPMASAGGQYQSDGQYQYSAGSHDADGSLSVDFEILEFTWRSIVLLIGLVFIVPAPWAIVWYLKWIVPCVHVPGRPNLSFEGQAMTLVPWYFGAIVLIIGGALTGVHWISDLMFLVQIALYWLFLKWFVANLASNGQPLGFSFSGSFWAYLGWSVLTAISFITIIGWAWVYVAWARWFCGISRALGVRLSSPAPGWSFFGVRSWPRSPAPSSSRLHGCIAGCRAGWRRRRFLSNDIRRKICSVTCARAASLPA